MLIKNLFTAFAMWLCLSATQQTFAQKTETLSSVKPEIDQTVKRCLLYEQINDRLKTHRDTFYEKVKSPLPEVFSDSCILCVRKEANNNIAVGLTKDGSIVHWYTINQNCWTFHEKKMLEEGELQGVLMEGMTSNAIFGWAAKLLEAQQPSKLYRMIWTARGATGYGPWYVDSLLVDGLAKNSNYQNPSIYHRVQDTLVDFNFKYLLAKLADMSIAAGEKMKLSGTIGQIKYQNREDAGGLWSTLEILQKGSRILRVSWMPDGFVCFWTYTSGVYSDSIWCLTKDSGAWEYDDVVVVFDVGKVLHIQKCIEILEEASKD